jgi:hypothetical protein
MKSLIPIALFLLASSAYAKDSSGVYGTGDDAVTITTSLSPTHNDLTFDARKGSSVAEDVGAVSDPAGDGKDILRSNEFSLGGDTYKFKGGKLFKKGKNGKWKAMPKKKEPKKRGKGSRSGGIDSARLEAGDYAPSDGTLFGDNGTVQYLYLGQRAPFGGIFAPGEEVTSIPNR